MLAHIQKTLYGSTPATFVCAYSLSDSVARLSAASVRTPFGALTRQAAVGKVTADRVRLQRSIPFVGNSCKPFFVGKFEQQRVTVRLVGNFSMHISVKIFNTIWFGFGVVWVIFACFEVSRSSSEKWWLPFFGIGMLLAGYGLVRLGQWFARNDQEWLSNVITNAIGAQNST